MWIKYFKTLSLTAIQGVLATEAIAHPEKPEAAKSAQQQSSPRNIDGPLTEYELHYGIPQSRSRGSSSTDRN